MGNSGASKLDNYLSIVRDVSPSGKESPNKLMELRAVEVSTSLCGSRAKASGTN